MKTKVTEWGNSHGIRITSAMMDHLNAGPGDEVEIAFTGRGLEIKKNEPTIEYAETVTQEALEAIIKATNPVRQVSDPYAETDVSYLVVSLNQCKPIIREVPKGSPHAYSTLADAKEAARQIIQAAISDAKESLSELRQLGIANITYISL